MKRPDIKLIDSYFSGNCPKESIAEVQRWLQTKEGQEHIATDMDLMMEEEEIPDFDVEIPSSQILRNINSKIRRKQLWVKALKVACVVLPLLPANLFLINEYTKPKAAIEYRTLHVDNAEKMTLVLADGSELLVNSGTTVEYPTTFGSESREIKVDGEIFIDVAKDPNRPFTVQTEAMDIEVLGTRFNVHAYSEDSNASVYLERGSVRINRGEDQNLESYMLEPNQVAVLDKATGECNISNVDSELYCSWKSDYYVFNDTPINEILKCVERTAGVEFSVNDDTLLKYTYNIVYDTKNINQLLDDMSAITPIRFTRSGNSIKINLK